MAKRKVFAGLGTPGSAGNARTNRRASVRFPMEQEVRYKIFNPKTIEVGFGRTINISSRGVLFTAQRTLACGERLELAVDWPVALDDGCGLKLVTAGRVVRSEGTRAAIAIERYEFRTRRNVCGSQSGGMAVHACA